MAEPEPWMAEDAIGSFADAIAELRRRHLAGEAVPKTGYFARADNDAGLPRGHAETPAAQTSTEHTKDEP